MWGYLHHVLWNWAGILLTVDAGVALFERYLRNVVERYLHWKLHVPDAIKISFAIVVLLIAQYLAYQNVQEDLVQAGKDNNGLHTAINSLNTRISNQEDEIKRLRAARPTNLGQSADNTKKLIADTKLLVSDLRKLQADREATVQKAALTRNNVMQNAKSDAEKHVAEIRYGDAMQTNDRETNDKYRNKYEVDAIRLRDTLLERLPPGSRGVPDYDYTGAGDAFYALGSSVADDLERLAKTLQDQKSP